MTATKHAAPMTRHALALSLFAEQERREYDPRLMDDRRPDRLTMHPDTWLDLLADRDDRHAGDIGTGAGRMWRGIPVTTDVTCVPGVVGAEWPEVAP